MRNILTIDLEDWYQTNSYNPIVSVSEWDKFEGILSDASLKILEILNMFNVKATFFVLAYNAKRFPDLIRCIQQQGHELAIHGYYHELVYKQTPEQFSKNISDAKKIVEDICQKKVIGYRAPNWSVNSSCKWAFDILFQTGFLYDSSVKGRDLDRLKADIPAGLMEIPRSEFKFLNIGIPLAGGFFLRAYPYCLTNSFIKRKNSHDQRVVVYLHPWEFDSSRRDIAPGFPGNIVSGFNLKKTDRVFSRLLEDFKFDSVKNTFFSQK